MELYDLAAFRRQKDKCSSLTNPRMTTGFASYQQLKVTRKSKNWCGKGVGRHLPAALRAGMLISPPGEPELCEDLFRDWEHFWLNPVCRVAPGKIWEIQLFLLVLPLVSVHDIDVLKCGVRMGGLCWSPDPAPAASWSSVIHMQPAWCVLERLGCRGDTPRVPHPELCHQEMLWISSPLLFRSSLLIVGLEGSPFSQPVWHWAVLCRLPKLRCHGISYSQIMFFLVERVFFILIHIFLSVSPSLLYSAHALQTGKGFSSLQKSLCVWPLLGLSILPLLILVHSWRVFVLFPPLPSFLLWADISESSHSTCIGHFQANSKWIKGKIMSISAFFILEGSVSSMGAFESVK